MRKPSMGGCIRVCQTGMLAAICFGSVQAQNDYAVNRSPKLSGSRSTITSASGKTARTRAAFAVITGTVTNPDGSPAADVTVTVKGTKKFAVTKADGSFSIAANVGDVIVFSSVGFATQEVKVTDETPLGIKLTDDKKEMNEVVVTALGIKKQARSVGYSTTQVDGSKLTEARTQNLGDGLTGQVAGVSVAGVSTGPYGSSRVLIRGNSSLGGNNQPLYVIDNVPYDNSNQGSSGQWGGADYGDGLSNINPDDIESIQVLKGVAASALYGWRGGNGAILVTTKSGSKQKNIGVELNNNITATHFIDERDYQYKYGQGSQGVLPINDTVGNSTALSSWGPKIDGISQAVNSFGDTYTYKAQKDNWNHFFGTGLTNQSSVALLGSNDKGHFRLGISNLYLNSNIPNSWMKQQGLNFNTTYNLTPKLSFTLTANYVFENVFNRASFSDAPGNVIAPLLYLANTFDVRWLKARTNATNDELLPNRTDIYDENPYFVAHDFQNSTARNRLTGGLTLKYQILDWLYAQAQITRDGYTFDLRQVTPNGVQYSNNGGGSINLSSTNQHELDGNAMLGLNKKFGEFTVNAAGGVYSQSNKYANISGGGGPFVIPYFYSINNVSNRPLGYSFSNRQINSVYGNVDLGYKNFLFLNFTARKDWFSTLNINTDNYLYPSVSGSFVFSDAFKLPEWISFGKLRASFGESSNDGAASPYANSLPYGLQGYTINGQSVGDISTSTIPNKLLKPVSIKEAEVGFNIEFLNNRIGADVALYNKQTTDDIVPVTIAQTSGYSSNLINIGKLRNTGIEILLTGTPVKTKNFTWNVSWNFAYNNNLVLSAGEGANSFVLDVPRNGTASIQAVKGQIYGQIVGYKYLRNASHQIIFDTTGLPERTADLQNLGSGQYNKTGGISNDFHYKDWGLSFLIDYKFGAKLYSQTNMALYGDGLSKKTLVQREVGNYKGAGYVGKGVQEDGKVNDVAINTQTYFGQIAGGGDNIDEEFVYDASFIKLRNLILSYNLPKSILGNGFFKSVSLSLVARNVAILLKHTPNIDPESNYSNGNAQGLELSGYPAYRSLGVNLNVKF